MLICQSADSKYVSIALRMRANETAANGYTITIMTAAIVIVNNMLLLNKNSMCFIWFGFNIKYVHLFAQKPIHNNNTKLS